MLAPFFYIHGRPLECATFYAVGNTGRLGMAKEAEGKSKLDKILEAQRDYIAKREVGYRDRALKLYPWVCGGCALRWPGR